MSATILMAAIGVELATATSMSWPWSTSDGEHGRRPGLDRRISSPGGSIRRCRGCSSSWREGTQQSDPTPSVWPPAIQRCQLTSSSACPCIWSCERQEGAPSGLGPGRRKRRAALAQPARSMRNRAVSGQTEGLEEILDADHGEGASALPHENATSSRTRSARCARSATSNAGDTPRWPDGRRRPAGGPENLPSPQALSPADDPPKCSPTEHLRKARPTVPCPAS